MPVAGLSHHLLTRAQGKLVWDYDPPGDAVVRIAGSYDHVSRTFSWQEQYHPDHFLISTVVTGTGGIDAAGGETSAYTITTTDKLGRVTVTENKVQRAGCSVQRGFRPQGTVDWHLHTGTFAPSGYSFVEWQNPERWVDVVGAGWPADASGTMHADGTYSSSFSSPPSGCDDETGDCWGPWIWYSQTENGASSGDSTTTYHWFNDWGTYVDGNLHVLLDGTRILHEYVSTEDWGWVTDYTRSYDGYGQGTFSAWFYDPATQEWHPDVCLITSTPASCSVACSDRTLGCWMVD